MKTKFLKSRRDKHRGEEIDMTVNAASEKAANRTTKSSAFGHSNLGRNISPDAGKRGGARLTGGKAVNPAGGVGKGAGMGDPTRSGSVRSMPKTGSAEDVIKLKKKKGGLRFLKSRS